MNKATIITVPVLIIGFNRPETIRQCISKLRESRPTSLYFACDGARSEDSDEALRVNEVRHIMENEIEWPCKKHYHYNSVNKGCEVTESEAITWVLEDNKYVIVIEDDIIASYSFLQFAQEMLYRYENNEQVFQVASENATPMPFPNDEDYCFSMFGHIWGWATWKRAWEHFDLYVHDFDETLKSLSNRKDLRSEDKKHLKRLCKQLMREERKNESFPKHTWDVIWSYIKWRDGGLTIVPRVHLSSNIGVVGLHTKVRTHSHFRPYCEEFEVRKHPRAIERNISYDDYHYEKIIKQPPFVIRQWRRGKNCFRRFFQGRK